MSIVRIGLAETKKFAEGYEAIFGKKTARSSEAASSEEAKTAKKGAAKPARKKTPKKK